MVLLLGWYLLIHATCHSSAWYPVSAPWGPSVSVGVSVKRQDTFTPDSSRNMRLWILLHMQTAAHLMFYWFKRPKIRNMAIKWLFHQNNVTPIKTLNKDIISILYQWSMMHYLHAIKAIQIQHVKITLYKWLGHMFSWINNLNINTHIRFFFSTVPFDSCVPTVERQANIN